MVSPAPTTQPISREQLVARSIACRPTADGPRQQARRCWTSSTAPPRPHGDRRTGRPGAPQQPAGRGRRLCRRGPGRCRGRRARGAELGRTSAAPAGSPCSRGSRSSSPSSASRSPRSGPGWAGDAAARARRAAGALASTALTIAAATAAGTSASCRPATSCSRSRRRSSMIAVAQALAPSAVSETAGIVAVALLARGPGGSRRLVRGVDGSPWLFWPHIRRVVFDRRTEMDKQSKSNNRIPRTCICILVVTRGTYRVTQLLDHQQQARVDFIL